MTRHYERAVAKSAPVNGVLVCQCVGPELAGYLSDVGSRLPAGVVMDALHFDYGRRVGMCANLPNGRRAVINCASDARPSAIDAADVLASTLGLVQ